jgi:hypothetical protein
MELTENFKLPLTALIEGVRVRDCHCCHQPQLNHALLAVSRRHHHPGTGKNQQTGDKFDLNFSSPRNLFNAHGLTENSRISPGGR